MLYFSTPEQPASDGELVENNALESWKLQATAESGRELTNVINEDKREEQEDEMKEKI